MQKMLSLCIPTNGVTEWVTAVLDSITTQCANKNLYEILICDNGTNSELEKYINNYQKKYNNIIYKKSASYGFLNQIDCFKMANGEFIKFINHRTKLVDGSIDRLLKFISENRDEKPTVFFSNGSLKVKNTILETNNFDLFVRNLGIYSSWSGGIGIWQSELKNVLQKKDFNELFPHMDILFFSRDNKKYIIDNNKIFDEIDIGHTKKGKYNLFYAFAVEYPCILLELMRSGNISLDTMHYIMRQNEKFITNLYRQFIIKKEPSAYTFENYKKYINLFYNEKNIRLRAYFPPIFRRI